MIILLSRREFSLDSLTSLYNVVLKFEKWKAMTYFPFLKAVEVVIASRSLPGDRGPSVNFIVACGSSSCFRCTDYLRVHGRER